MKRYIIQADYTTLDKSAHVFSQAGDSISDLANQVRNCVEELHNGGWTGVGAHAFFDEMQSLVFPALRRLINTLNQSRSVTRHISKLLQDAETEAGNLFRSSSRSPALRFPPDLKRPFISSETIESTILTNLPTVIAYLEQTPAGRDLLEQLSDAKVKFSLPTGTQIGDLSNLTYVASPFQGNFTLGYTGYGTGITVLPVSLAELEGAAGEFDAKYGGNLRISSSRWTFPMSETMLANTLAHEMQHALDRQLGIVQDVNIDLDGTDIRAIETALTRQVEYDVLTEVRAHARGESVAGDKPFNLNDITRFDQLSKAQVRDILETKGYGMDYINNMNRQFDQVYANHPELGLRRANIVMKSDGSIRVEISVAKTTTEVLYTKLEDIFGWFKS